MFSNNFILILNNLFNCLCLFMPASKKEGHIVSHMSVSQLESQPVHCM